MAVQVEIQSPIEIEKGSYFTISTTWHEEDKPPPRNYTVFCSEKCGVNRAMKGKKGMGPGCPYFITSSPMEGARDDAGMAQIHEATAECKIGKPDIVKSGSTLIVDADVKSGRVEIYR